MKRTPWTVVSLTVAAALDSLTAVHAQELQHAAMPNRIHISWVNETGGESPFCRSDIVRLLCTLMMRQRA